MISSGIIVISGIVIVLAVTVFFGFIFYSMYNNLTIKHWLPQTIIVGITITSLAVCAGIIDNNNSKMKKSIENTIASNYDNVLDYHNYKDNKTFVSGDSRYTFYYDKRTKTLIILKGSNIDAVFVDGVKQNDQKHQIRLIKRKTVYHIKQMMQIRQIQIKLTAIQTPPATHLPLFLPLQSACSRKYRTRSSPDTTMPP